MLKGLGMKNAPEFGVSVLNLRSCLTNLISFYDKMTHLTDKGKSVDVVYLDFSEVFDTVSQSILPEKLVAHGLDRCTVH